MADKWSARLLRTRAQVQTLIAGAGLNYPGFFQISNAVGATKQILVWAKSASSISSFAVNITDDTIGIYDIGADTFTIETANNNLGQDDESYTPTVTVGGAAATTVDVDGLAQAILINTHSVTVMVKFNIVFDVAEAIVDGTFTLPPSFLPTNNFTAKPDVLASVTIYNEGAFSPILFGAAIFALAASKTCYFSFNTDTMGSDCSLIAILRYNKNN